MNADFLYPVYSDPALNFLEGLAQNVATAMNNLPGLPNTASRRYFIRAIEVATMENFGPEFNFFGSAAGLTVDPATDTFIARYGFTSNMGERLSGAGLYRYYVDGLSIPYFDLDTDGVITPPSLHVVLQNIAATAKTAGAPGAVKATVWVGIAASVQG